VEQDHRNVKRRAWLAKGYGSLPTAWRTLRGIETMLKKGSARWVTKGNVVGQVKTFGAIRERFEITNRTIIRWKKHFLAHPAVRTMTKERRYSGDWLDRFKVYQMILTPF
jgi:hypothetical protein